LIKNKLLKKIDPFDVIFNGHGYEDIDLLYRILHLYQNIPSEDKHISSDRQYSIIFSNGILKHLYRMSLKNFINEIFTLHTFHPIVRKNYYDKREINLNKFIDKHSLKLEKIANEDICRNICDNVNYLCNVSKELCLSPIDFSFLFFNIPHAKQSSIFYPIKLFFSLLFQKIILKQ